MSAKRILLIVVLALTVLRCGLVFFEAVSPQEAYYFMCSLHPDLAYFDGPSGTALMIAATGSLWRFLAPFWALAATFACFLLGGRLGHAERGAWTALALNALPVFNNAALRVGPELPALTFVLLALVCFRSAYEQEKDNLPWWLATGICSALAVWFSYAAVLVVVAIGTITLISPKHRRGRDIGCLALVVVFTMAALAPALEWNERQDWIPLAGGTLQTFWQFDFFGFFRAVGSSLLKFSPFVLITLIMAWLVSAREAQQHLRARSVFAGALPFLVCWFYFLLRGIDVSLLFLMAAPVLLFYALGLADLFRKVMLASLALGVLFSVWSVVSTTREGKAWQAIAGALRDLESQKTDGVSGGLFFIAENEKLASVLGYYLRSYFMPPAGHPTVYVQESQAMGNQYALWPSYDDFVETDKVVDEYFKDEQHGENLFVGRSALYIGHERAEDLPQSIRGAFQSVQEISKVTIPGNPLVTEPLYIYLCLNYQTLPL